MRAYNFFSFLYGRTAARLEREAVTCGLAQAQVRAGERVLEVGVGTAAAFARLWPRVGAAGQLIGVDVSPWMLKATRRRVARRGGQADAWLVRADACALPFPGNYFDLVWASYLLDLIPTEELTPLLGEFRRVLRSGGRLLLVNFSKQGHRLTWWERAYRLTPDWLVAYLFGGCRPVLAESYVRAAGFEAVERTFIPGGLHSEIILARK
ncbi:MAG: methyltransferase domain-containing protein [Acidobacteria bacterium]|nr:methyltransferase domain-containing protein [Acidobacteriota bacterium]